MAKAATYRDVGVDIEAGDRFTRSIADLMRHTFTPRVIENTGGFGSLFALDYDRKLLKRNYRRPVLVASTDGVGTKLRIALLTGRHRTVGIDLVAMCVNDVITLGAEPLFFLDYLATGRLDERVLHDVVAGIADGCARAKCALIGGETAEMPSFYKDGEYDCAGFAVGVVERSRVIDPSAAAPGDVLIGLASSGLHSNGYSLARSVLGADSKKSLARKIGADGTTLGEELLRPTRIYAHAVGSVLGAYRVKKVVHGIAHVTGGGIEGNLARAIAPDTDAVVTRGSWEEPAVFSLIKEEGGMADEEMFRVFNMGLGMVLVVSPFYADAVVRRLEKAGESARRIGVLARGSGKVRLRARRARKA